MKICLLGSHPASCNLAPFGDPAWEIWACSPINYAQPRVDAWFELHSLDRKCVPANDPYINVIKEHPRVYIAVPDSRLPNGVIYPKDKILAKYPQKHHTFFSSSVAWMMALAIDRRPTEIGLWGIDMAAGDEYEYQRPGLHYFMGVAETLGTKIYAPPQSDIVELHPLYGFKEQWRSYWKLRAREKELDERIKHIDKVLNAQETEKLQLLGAKQSISYEKNTWMKP